jgi:hypothetical protein
MRGKLTDLRGEQVQRGGRTGRRGAPCALSELAVYKRPSVGASLVFTPMTSARPYGGMWSQPEHAAANDRRRDL